jgi:RNA polymerase sigma factor (sigma-70 family)
MRKRILLSDGRQKPRLDRGGRGGNDLQTQLTARLRLGDPAALERAIDCYGAYAAKIIAAFLNRRMTQEDMEEAVSDVFVALWNSRERLESDDLRPYLAAIARNTARQRLRALHPTEPLPEETELPDETPSPEGLTETAESAAELREAIDSLPPEDRELFVRFYYLDQTVAEISAVTGQNQATLRSRLRRGRMKLKQYLTERGIAR